MGFIVGGVTACKHWKIRIFERLEGVFRVVCCVFDDVILVLILSLLRRL